MNKKISIFIVLIMLLNIIISSFINISLAVTISTKENTENIKKNPDSYWSTKNAPLFYGTTKITLKKGIIDEFNILDTRFRIFARDFEDGDLSQKIKHSGEIKIDEVGEYEIIYTVTDSHNNTTTLTVPVIVTDDENEKITVERTIYTIPSVWNMDLAEFSRCNYGDRQILGIYLSANQSVQARIISAENNINVNFINNDSHKETAVTIPTTGEWITLKNNKDNVGYDSVPLLKTTVLSKANTQLDKTYKIELKYDETIKPLNYYHYQDNEEKFKSEWIQSGDSYGVIESETLILVVPYTDIKYMTNYYRNGFTTLDKFLEYYQKVVEKMDEYVGLEFNPEKITDQNVRTKYLVRANVNGVGAAYYAGDHVGVNNASMGSFFEMNWGGLHELGHGYQGSLGKGEMLLGEVSNNILGHYIQVDKSIYTATGNWLGELSAIEESRNAERLKGKTFTQVDEPTRLYVIVNLLNTFEKGTTYAKMYSWYREQLHLGRTMTNQDAYTEAIADIYDINIIPYMEAWGLNLSNKVKEKIYEAKYPSMNILKDIVSEEDLEKIMIGEKTDLKYSLISDIALQKYNATGNLKLYIDIDEFDNIKGKVILLKQGTEIIRAIKIENEQIELKNIPIGTYYLQMPILIEYEQNITNIQIKSNIDNIYTYKYSKAEEIEFNNYLMMRVLGYNYDTIAYQLTFKEKYTKAEIKYPNKSAMGGNEYIKIYNNEGIIVSEDLATGGYFDFSKGTHEIELKPGYTIEVNYPNKHENKVVVYNTLTNQVMPEYGALNTATRYTVTENGLIREDMNEEEAKDLAYFQLKKHLISIIEDYKNKVTDEELNNKVINFKEKAYIVGVYNLLREEDQKEYTSLIDAIKRGGSPLITVTGDIFSYEIGSIIDLYKFIEATDNEDGNILINENSTKIITNLKNDMPGIYTVNYQVIDSDNNITTEIIQIEILGNIDIPEDDDKDEEEIMPPEISEDNKNEEWMPPQNIIEEKNEEEKTTPIEEIEKNSEENTIIQEEILEKTEIQEAIEEHQEEPEIIDYSDDYNDTDILPNAGNRSNIIMKISTILIIICLISFCIFKKIFKRK